MSRIGSDATYKASAILKAAVALLRIILPAAIFVSMKNGQDGHAKRF